MTLLSVDGLTVRYGAVLAVEDVTLEVPEAGAVALLGANGAGKTTMLRALGGLLGFHRGQIAAGDILFDGRSIKGREPAKLVADGLAQTLEGRRIFSDLTVGENLRLGAFPARARARLHATRDELLELFPRLRERLGQAAGTLSGGEQQMLAIARALMARPRLLMLDEPSLGLAPMVIAEIASALRRITEQGTAVLLVDQSTTLALRVTEYAYLLETGHVAARGATTSLLADGDVRASYLGTADGQDVLADEVKTR